MDAQQNFLNFVTVSIISLSTGFCDFFGSEKLIFSHNFVGGVEPKIYQNLSISATCR